MANKVCVECEKIKDCSRCEYCRKYICKDCDSYHRCDTQLDF